MKNEKDLLDELYSIAKQNFDDKEFAFSELIKKCIEHTNYTNEYIKKNIGDIYVNLLIDDRFVCNGDNKWVLKENLSFDEYKKRVNDLYEFCYSPVTDDSEEIDINNENIIDEEDVENEIDYNNEYESENIMVSDSLNISNEDIEIEDEDEDDANTIIDK